MATTTYILNTSLEGAGATGTDLLSGTAVSNAGAQGKVWVSATTGVNGDDFTAASRNCTFTLFGRESGVTVVPADSGFVLGTNALSQQGRVVFYGRVRPNEPLSLNITSSENTAVEVFSVMVKTE